MTVAGAVYTALFIVFVLELATLFYVEFIKE